LFDEKEAPEVKKADANSFSFPGKTLSNFGSLKKASKKQGEPGKPLFAFSCDLPNFSSKLNKKNDEDGDADAWK
jgi:hypothetical protein